MSNDKVRASDYPEYGVRQVRREERDKAGVMTTTINGLCVHGVGLDYCNRDHGGNAVPGPAKRHTLTTKIMGTITLVGFIIITGLLTAWGFDLLWHAGLGWLAFAIGTLWVAVAALIIGGTVEEIRK
ncbi:hypothetical protein LAROYE_77 [Arthrobacter phage Laroye]|uniref:Uncharacterized protein n=1 Tax=Arthrobacter phage Laroye TaxID=1772305 RepID=A0A0U4JZH3_9CAUD|nr:hypothetical protein FDH64_gp77 [Arthrobacter phage Laroye]ALY09602.1 hypothetical protein LAROYE_77 [Arthrobacter phage Laroye]